MFVYVCVCATPKHKPFEFSMHCSSVLNTTHFNTHWSGPCVFHTHNKKKKRNKTNECERRNMRTPNGRNEMKNVDYKHGTKYHVGMWLNIKNFHSSTAVIAWTSMRIGPIRILVCCNFQRSRNFKSEIVRNKSPTSSKDTEKKSINNSKIFTIHEKCISKR